MARDNCPTVPWDELPESAVDAICHVVERLASDRYTGELTLSCNQGGVRNVRAVTDYKPGSRNVSVSPFETE